MAGDTVDCKYPPNRWGQGKPHLSAELDLTYCERTLPRSKKEKQMANQPTSTPTPTQDTPSAAALYRAEHQQDVLNRLRRIEGQVRGLAEMIQAGRDCEEVAQQMTATRRAMDKAFYRMMTCTVIEAVTSSGDHEAARSEIERKAKLLEKYG